MKISFSRRFKITFLSTVLIGLAAHLFALTNVLKNHDNILMTGYGAGTSSGRWFLGWFGDIVHDVWGNYNIPLFNGLLSILLLALAAYFGVLLFDIRDLVLCVLWGGCFLAFPAVTSMMFYMYTIPYYSLAILMVMASVYCTVRYKFGWIASIILLTCSLGIYQAFYPLAAGLYVTILIISSVTGKYRVKEAFIKAFSYLGILIAAMASYFVILKIRLHLLNMQLDTYKGINTMGQIKLSEIPAMLKKAYKDFFLLPFHDYYQMAATKIISWMLILLAALSIGMILLLLFRKGFKNLRRRWPAFLFLILYPMAVNSITLMCFHSKIYTLMIFPNVLIYLMPILLVSEMGKTNPVKTEGKVFGGLRILTCAALGLVVANYTWQSNGNYTTMYYTNQQMYNYLNSMVTQIKEADGFRTDLQWAFIGNYIQDPLYENPWWEAPFWYGGNKKMLLNEYSRDQFIPQFLGYHVSWADDEQVQELKENQIVKEMPTYPNDGSIKVIGDTVVIKLQDTEKEK